MEKWLLNCLRSQFKITGFLLLFGFALHFYLSQLFSRQFTFQKFLVLCTSGYNFENNSEICIQYSINNIAIVIAFFFSCLDGTRG